METLTEKAGVMYGHQNYADYNRVTTATEITSKEIKAGHRLIKNLEEKIQEKATKQQEYKVLEATEENLALIEVIRELKRIGRLVGAKVKTSIYYSDQIDHVTVSTRNTQRKYFLDSSNTKDAEYYRNYLQADVDEKGLFEENRVVLVQYFQRVSREAYYSTGDHIAVPNKRDIVIVPISTTRAVRETYSPNLLNDYNQYQIIKHNGEEKALERIGHNSKGYIYKIITGQQVQEIKTKLEALEQSIQASLIEV